MNPDFHSYEDITDNSPRRDVLNKKMGNQREYKTAVKNTIHGERFELISAYIDGAATPEECALVEEWLKSDPEVQRLHARLLNLSQEWENIPVPPPQQSIEETIAQVFARLDAEAAETVVTETSTERLELLSAYIDSEVSAKERQQVEEWLANDTNLQRQYARLLNLQTAIKEVPVPISQPVETTVEQFFARLDAEKTQEMTNVVTLQRDRFELLSAYLDGEVDAAERKQVEEWLQNDTIVQGLYKRLLNLRSGMQNMPVPATEPAVEKTVEQVLARIERQPKLRLILGGVAAAAALALAAISSLLTSEPSFSPQMATEPQPKATPEKLMIAINNPVVEIPKPAQSYQERTIMSRALFIE